jgi:uncharacterized protein YidB (DUF937 family)
MSVTRKLLSWIKRGSNQQVATDQLERAIAAEILKIWSNKPAYPGRKPEAVDKVTPDGRLPTEVEPIVSASSRSSPTRELMQAC